MQRNHHDRPHRSIACHPPNQMKIRLGTKLFSSISMWFQRRFPCAQVDDKQWNDAVDHGGCVGIKSQSRWIAAHWNNYRKVYKYRLLLLIIFNPSSSKIPRIDKNRHNDYLCTKDRRPTSEFLRNVRAGTLWYNLWPNNHQYSILLYQQSFPGVPKIRV